MAQVFFEDFIPGQTVRYGRFKIDREALVAFSRAYDPQDFHLDEEAARSSFAGRLIGSGWMTAAIHHRMLCDDLLLHAACLGGPGVEELKWLKPVHPGDVLHARRRVLAVRASASRPDRGVVHFAQEVFNQDDEAVLFLSNWIMFRRRTDGAVGPQDSAPATGAHVAVETVKDRPSVKPGAEDAHLDFVEDIALGTRIELGDYTFSEDGIVDYARRFDPQFFHVDKAAATGSPYGGLIASGWQTAAGWMRCFADHRAAATAKAIAAGRPVAVLGPSPGLRALKWLKPVRPGDTIRYASTLIDKRNSASRPGWGLVFHHNTGDNQHGERVFEFNGCVFWERRRP